MLPEGLLTVRDPPVPGARSGDIDRIVLEVFS
ncbi:MAG: hypothetical protein K0S78_4845 [Thermomicrobiales bacterium]|jgi:hypothetical protein|nr:hypothetical protein [Thermomicrobiales bacterium]